MKISLLIVQWIAVDVMDDLPRFGSRDLAVFPLPAASLASVAKTMRFNKGSMRTIRLFDGRALDGIGFGDVCNRADHLITPTHMFAVGESSHFPRIRKERVAVPVPHLVMADAHFTRGNRTVTVFAGSTNSLSAPGVVDSAVLLLSLVVHQAQAIGRMLSSATIHRTNLIEFWRSHVRSLSICFPKLYQRYKALGNSFAVPVVRWIGERIQLVDGIEVMKQEAA